MAKMVEIVYIKVKISLWGAIKLRIAGIGKSPNEIIPENIVEVETK